MAVWESELARLIVYYAHPGHRFSRANKMMATAARSVAGITFVDLYGEYPRHNIDVDREQARLLAHDVILFQFPLFWYSSPSLVKEWQDLVLQHGFAYGHEGHKLAGKKLLLALTAGGAEAAYAPKGYQQFPLRAFLTPFEQTAHLCKMEFLAPYVLYGALTADETFEIAPHVEGYRQLLQSIRDDVYPFEEATQRDVVTFHDLPVPHKA